MPAKKNDESKGKPRQVRGEGSVFQRDTDGRWVARIPLGGGKRKDEYYDTRKEAERARRRMLNERDAGRLVTERDQTLAEYLDYWIEAHRVSTRLSTYVTYRSHLHFRVIPVLGYVSLKKLNIEMFQALYQDWAKDGLSSHTIRLIHRIMNKAFNDAIQWRKLAYNPLSGIKLPKEGKPKSITLLSEEEVERLLDCLEQTRLYPLFRMALLLGMRIGELIGLKWSDIDFDQSILRIQRTVTYLKDPAVGRHAFYEGPPKTDAGERIVYLPQDIVKMLQEHRLSQQKARAVASQWTDRDLLFCTRTGNYIVTGNIRKILNEVLDLVGLSHMKFHALRHNANLILKRMGVDPVVRKEMLGHTSLDMTEGVYGGSTPDMHQKVARMIDKLFGSEEG